ncbi:hypothetical protein SHKM778_57260 [Streptomyces sp. KM77-8]|uniref:Glutamate racemase n=1 Tax=Streptomyces haneummycinicus TaxID=3074435 RepID=A0AAT9HPF7_9ACTN
MALTRRSLPHTRSPGPPIDYRGRVKIALMDSGIGLLAATAAVRRLRPDADLVLSLDPDGMPWGPRTTEDLTERALLVAEAAAAHRPDALIVGCNTATVHALTALRARLEPALPVVGTVPAIKPAAAGGGPLAIWATPATTGSPYQRDLIENFADGVTVAEVPCWGSPRRSSGRTRRRSTPPSRRRPHSPRRRHDRRSGLHPLRTGRRAHPGRRTAPRPAAARPARLRRSRRRPGAAPARRTARPAAAASGTLTVLLSGREGALPPAALTYAEGRLLGRAAAARTAQ